MVNPENISQELQKLTYTMTNMEDCVAFYGEEIFPGMLCTGQVPMIEEHAAPGDSGKFP